MLSDFIIDYNLAAKFNNIDLKSEIIIPIKEEELFITIATVTNDIKNFELLDEINKPLKNIVFSKNEIYQSLQFLDTKLELFNISTLENNIDSKIDTFLILIVEISLNLNSSDIHFESTLNSFQIRFRIDGVLKHFITLKKKFLNTLSSYIKLKSNLDISLKRLPQNASFSMKIKNKKYDFRISTMPTIDGESIVIRILENDTINKKLDALGFRKEDLKTIKEKINQTSGLILLTGPTGSGKTTTLYSMIKDINYIGKKIITIEDPVEYKIQNVQQISVNNEIGLTFEKILTNILRQDPDVILIGEIRDKESLKIAIQASLTGHLVFATLHTNNALNTIHRVLDLGGESFLLSNTLKSIISQRLVRKLCDKCKKYSENLASYTAVGCEFCNYEGYIGRIMLYEMININDHLSNMIAKKENTKEIQSYLKSIAYIDIKSFSNTIVTEGKSTIDEVYNIV